VSGWLALQILAVGLIGPETKKKSLEMLAPDSPEGSPDTVAEVSRST
jgi:hypothetical protein